MKKSGFQKLAETRERMKQNGCTEVTAASSNENWQYAIFAQVDRGIVYLDKYVAGPETLTNFKMGMSVGDARDLIAALQNLGVQS